MSRATLSKRPSTSTGTRFVSSENHYCHVFSSRLVGSSHGQVYVGQHLRYDGPGRLFFLLVFFVRLEEIFMSLYCVICRRPVGEGSSGCYACITTSPRLACTVCNRSVAQGSTSCSYCSPSQSVSLAPLPELPPLPGVIVRAAAIPILPERYTVNRHGVTADIQLNPTDVKIMQLEAQLIAMLESYADAANYRSGFSELARSNIKDCRLLAINLREEIERIRGPQG